MPHSSSTCIQELPLRVNSRLHACLLKSKKVPHGTFHNDQPNTLAFASTHHAAPCQISTSTHQTPCTPTVEQHKSDVASNRMDFISHFFSCTASIPQHLHVPAMCRLEHAFAYARPREIAKAQPPTRRTCKPSRPPQELSRTSSTQIPLPTSKTKHVFDFSCHQPNSRATRDEQTLITPFHSASMRPQDRPAIAFHNIHSRGHRP